MFLFKRTTIFIIAFLFSLNSFGDSRSGRSDPLALATTATSVNSLNNQNPSAKIQLTNSLFLAFGPQYYTRNTEKPASQTVVFSVLDPSTSYTLHVYNGGEDSQSNSRVSSAIIKLNGEDVLTPDDFKLNNSHIQKPIHLTTNNTLAVELRGKPGSNLMIKIIGVDNTPPTITAATSPVPNAAGWNNSDVTVSFVCSDTTSGIDFCPEPVHVQQEGAGQVVTGMATDRAGNTKSVSTTISIDKSPPLVTVNSPLPGTALEDSPAVIEGVIDETLSGLAAVTCNGTNATLSSSSFTCNAPLETGQNNIQILASDVAGNSSQTGLMVTYLGPKYAAIVDVRVSSDINFNDVPSDYTGLRYGEATRPYIPDAIGQRVTSQHIYAVYSPIGELRTSVWVKYDSIPELSTQAVLVDYGVFTNSCPDGWESAKGYPYLSLDNSVLPAGSNIWPATCTNRTQVLCLRYAPINESESFVTNVGMSNPTSAPACAGGGEANGGIWPMQTDGVNMIHGCGEWRYLCYGKGKVWPPMPTTDEITDEEKLALLTTYAPQVKLHNQETFWPSSVEWSFPYLTRVLWDEPPAGGVERYWLFASQALQEPSSVLPYFSGCNQTATDSPCTLDDTPVYAFWVEKPNDDVSSSKYVDLVYFFYYPYNRGKSVFNTIWGNHVGDWEHVTVRLWWNYDDQNGWSLQPTQIYLPAHNFGSTYDWDEITKVNNTPHPIVYSAKGSHGIWRESGDHFYGEVIQGVNLIDQTNDSGTYWDTWNYLEAFDYNLAQGLSGNNWPLWMSTDYDDPGDCGDPSNPACGPIFRWGNSKYTNYYCLAGFCRLEDGPTGPVEKDVWSDKSLR